MRTEEHHDRRIRRTKRMLKKAFIELLHTKEYEKIKVTDIVEAADVNRSTFYLHYKYKEQLVEEMIEELLEGLKKAFRHPYKNKKLLNLYTISPSDVKLFQFVKKHDHFFSLLKKRDAIPGFLNQFVQTLIQLFIEDFSLLPKQDKKTDNVLLITFRSYGILGLILEWIKSDYAASPKQMSEQLVNILNYQPLNVYEIKHPTYHTSEIATESKVMPSH